MKILEYFRKKKEKALEEDNSIRQENYESKEDSYRSLANEDVYTHAFDSPSKRKFVGTHSVSNKRKGILEKMKIKKSKRQRLFKGSHDANNKRKSFTDKMNIEEVKSNKDDEFTK